MDHNKQQETAHKPVKRKEMSRRQFLSYTLGGAGAFMAGGIAVVCGHEAQNPDNVLGYRPLVGMVGGKVFFRGPHGGFSQTDANLIPIDDKDWEWLKADLKQFLQQVKRKELFETLSDRSQWQLLTARTPQEKIGRLDYLLDT